MKEKTFIDLSPDECGETHSKVLLNAEQHFNISEILASMGLFGPAISHLILGTEEKIKALLLLLESKHFQLRKVRGVNKIFNQHFARHHIIRNFYSVWTFLKPFFEKWIATTEIMRFMRLMTMEGRVDL